VQAMATTFEEVEMGFVARSCGGHQRRPAHDAGPKSMGGVEASMDLEGSLIDVSLLKERKVDLAKLTTEREG
jgi:hypothetical protein